jgi:hypothetical protein
MRKLRHLVLITAGLVLSAVPAAAQGPCPEGQTAAGKCTNAARSEAARQGVIVATQPKLSYTGPPVRPGLDRRYDAERNRDRGLFYELFGPPGSPGSTR